MKNKTLNYRKTMIILLFIVIAGIIYLLSIFLAYPIFQNTRLIDSLAEIHSLFPLYYIAIVLIALTAASCLIWHIENKYLHLLLLLIFAIMLWLTPYYLTGFTRLPDGPWHVGVALHIPQVLGGDSIAFSNYARSYPGSFIYHYIILNIIGVIKPVTYINNFFPLFDVLLFVFLCYLFISRLFNQQVAFLSLLIAIPGLHYTQFHPSPHTIGALLMLTALLLLTKIDVISKVIAIAVIAGIIISHPTTPLLLSIFLMAAVVSNVIYTRRVGRTQIILAGILTVCFSGWFFWSQFYSFFAPLETAATLSQQVISTKPKVTQEYLMGTPFIYKDIYNLNKVIYIFYAITAIWGVLYIAVRAYSKKKSIRNWVSNLLGLNQSETFMVFSILLLFILTFLLAEMAHDLIETGLTYIILALSCLIASAISCLYRYMTNKKIIHSTVTAYLLFLALSFPIVAYSIDAYSSFPKSEKDGLKFLVANIPLNEKTVAMTMAKQLALCTQSSLNQTESVNLHAAQAPNLSKTQPDLIVFRSTGYYYAAMRLDLSFKNNRFTNYSLMIDSNKYDKIYSSSTFEIYSKNMGR
jgi:hypothetical protein